jgi:hypothetical protein
VALGGRGPRIAREKIGSDLQGVLPKSHILENRRSLKVQIILAENQNAPQVNLARHVFLAFANGDLGNTPFTFEIARKWIKLRDYGEAFTG